MAEAPLSVFDLADLRLPWSVRRRVRVLKRRGRTGLIAHAILTPRGGRGRRPPGPDITVHEGNIRLSLSNADNHRPKWTQLPVGSHELTFRATRSGASSVLRYGIELAGGDIFVAVCRPIQPWTLFGANPESDEWYLGVVRGDSDWPT